jgi:hypothetical protein
MSMGVLYGEAIAEYGGPWRFQSFRSIESASVCSHIGVWRPLSHFGVWGALA